MSEAYTRLADKLLTHHVRVGYQPLGDEPNPLQVSPTLHFIIPSCAFDDPVETAQQVSDLFLNDDVCLYIPGTMFDAQGTRYGRGGGWYDRLLAHVPVQWMRVGLCFESNFSDVPLSREVWDQPMDWVCVQTESGMDYYETNARSL